MFTSISCRRAKPDRTLNSTLETFELDAYFYGKSTSVATLCSPDATWFVGLTLHVLGDPVSITDGRYGVGIALNVRVKHTLLDRVPFNRCLCAVRFDGAVHVANSWLKRGVRFFAFVYAQSEFFIQRTLQSLLVDFRYQEPNTSLSVVSVVMLNRSSFRQLLHSLLKWIKQITVILDRHIASSGLLKWVKSRTP